jgi:hypothetical protein
MWHSDDRVGQVGNLRRIGNPPGPVSENCTGRLPIGRRLPTGPTKNEIYHKLNKIGAERKERGLVLQAFLPV